MGRIEKVNEYKENLRSQENYMKAAKRINQLLDVDSFSETSAFFSESGVITGSGTVEGRMIYLYSQYGPVNVKHAHKLDQLYNAALSMGVPVVGILDSCGMALSDGLENMEAYGRIYQAMADASGVVPQISVIFGDCVGTAAMIPGLSDFVFMKKEDAKLYLQSPNTYDDATNTTFNKYTSGEHHYWAGNVHFLSDNEVSCLTEVKKLLGYLPANNLDEAPLIMSSDDVNRADSKLNTIVPATEDLVDMTWIIKSIADNNDYLEISGGYAKRMHTCLIRLNGFTAGVLSLSGLLCERSVQKALKFINFCDSFNIPLINLTDVKGFKADQETGIGLIQRASSLMYAFAGATVPKVNVIVRNAIGSAYLAMGSKHSGADMVYAWPTANIGLLDADAAKKVLDKTVENDPVEAGKLGYVDDIIEPSQTRLKLILAIETLASKRVYKHSKKHGSIVF